MAKDVMKIFYYIIAHKNPQQLKLLVNKLCVSGANEYSLRKSPGRVCKINSGILVYVC